MNYLHWNSRTIFTVFPCCIASPVLILSLDITLQFLSKVYAKCVYPVSKSVVIIEYTIFCSVLFWHIVCSLWMCRWYDVVVIFFRCWNLDVICYVIWAKWHIVIFLLLVFMYDVMKMYVWNVALIAKLYSCVHAALTAKLWKFLNNIYVQNCIPVYCAWKGYSQLMMTTGTHLTSGPFFWEKKKN